MTHPASTPVPKRFLIQETRKSSVELPMRQPDYDADCGNCQGSGTFNGYACGCCNGTGAKLRVIFLGFDKDGIAVTRKLAPGEPTP